MTEPASELYIVRGADGLNVSLGPLQTNWLERGGFVEKTDTPGLWRALHGLTHEDIHTLVITQPELRECDFCRHAPGGWRVNCRPFRLKLGANAGGRLGGPDRPIFVCDVCVRYVRENRKAQLIDYAIASTVEYARDRGGHLADVVASQPWDRIKAGLTPVLREVVYGMFAHRIGYPERDNPESEAA